MKFLLLVSVTLALVLAAQGKSLSERAEPEEPTGDRQKALAVQPGQKPRIVRAVESEAPEHESNLRGLSIRNQHAKLARDVETETQLHGMSIEKQRAKLARDVETETQLHGMSIEKQRAKLARAVNGAEEVKTGMEIGSDGLARAAREADEEDHLPALEVVGKKAKVIR